MSEKKTSKGPNVPLTHYRSPASDGSELRGWFSFSFLLLSSSSHSSSSFLLKNGGGSTEGSIVCGSLGGWSSLDPPLDLPLCPTSRMHQCVVGVRTWNGGGSRSKYTPCDIYPTILSPLNVTSFFTGHQPIHLYRLDTKVLIYISNNVFWETVTSERPRSTDGSWEWQSHHDVSFLTGTPTSGKIMPLTFGTNPLKIWASLPSQ